MLKDVIEHTNLEVVHTAPNEVAASMIRGVLENAGIDVILRTHEIIAHGGILGSPGWGHLLVHKNDLEDAKLILEEYLEALAMDFSEDGDAEPDTV